MDHGAARPSPDELAAQLRQVSRYANGADPALLRQLATLAGGQMERLADFDEQCGFFFDEGFAVARNELVPEGRTDTNTAALLSMARQIIARSGALEPARLERELNRAAREADWEPDELFGALRLAVSGRRVTPPLAASMCILGKATSIERIDAAIDLLGSPENPILGSPRRPA